MRLDLRSTDWTGKAAEESLHDVKHRPSTATPCRSTSVRRPSQRRPLGTPAVTMRGLDEDGFREVGRVIVDALGRRRPTSTGCAAVVAVLCDEHPLYPGFRGYTTYMRRA